MIVHTLLLVLKTQKSFKEFGNSLNNLRKDHKQELGRGRESSESRNESTRINFGERLIRTVRHRKESVLKFTYKLQTGRHFVHKYLCTVQ
jgi:hypothetical protein